MRPLFLLAFLLPLAACQPPPATYREARPLMGTLVELHLEGPDRDALARGATAAWAEMARLTAQMNYFDSASPVGAIERAAGREAVAVPPELFAVLTQAQTVSKLSDGAFDITIRSPRALVDYRRLQLDPAHRSARLAQPGMRLDLGGIAKLPILDAARRVLQQHGARRGLINGGGDVIVWGATPWRVGVRDPRAPDRLLGVVLLQSGVVASSGDYERYTETGGKRRHHIIDPRTGESTTGPRGVTLVAESVEQLNGLSAAIMVMGSARGRALINTTPGLAGLIVERDRAVWISETLRPRFVATGE